MTFSLHSTLARLGVFSLGLALWVVAGKSLEKSGEFEREPNILSLNGSPFGKTIAMAMQGPVDVYWHAGEAHEHVHVPGEPCTECDHDSVGAPQEGPSAVAESGQAMAISTNLEAHEGCDHAGCDHGSHGEHNHKLELSGVAATPRSSFAESLRSGMLEQIQDWRAVKNTRHNPLAKSEVHKHFIRRQVEKKLMVTYRMDPTNYASYGAYFLFLSESSLSDRESSVEKALILSQLTVQHCLSEKQDAQALLTGAAAAHDAAQLLVNTGHDGAIPAAIQYSEVAEQFLDGFEQVALQMAFDGSWTNYSESRRAEMSSRAQLLRNLVEADRKIRGMNAENQTAEGEASAG